MASKEFDVEEPTRPIAHQTLDEVAAAWWDNIATSERPTLDIRRPGTSRSRAKTEVLK